VRIAHLSQCSGFVRVRDAHPTRLESALGLDWQGLRGVHNGLARICDGLGFEKPLRAIGYKAENRSYVMDPDVAGTIKSLV
jgi:hypothetical protein